MLTPFQIPDFGGLDLREEPEEGGPQSAIDLLNVDFDRQGAVRTRNGCVNLTGSPAAGGFGTIRFSPKYGGFAYMGTSIVIINTATTTSVTGKSLEAFACVGTPTADYVYFGGPSSAITRYDGASFTAPASLSSFRPVGMAVQPSENRLVIADVSTTTGCRVRFSDAGDPETFGTNNFVDLEPGGGDRVRGIVAWGTQLLVFKSDRFYVFYGNSTDSDGNPVFNYRTVHTGIGLGTSSSAGFDQQDQIAVARDGVYFIHRRRGLYRTTGGAPVKASQKLDPWFETMATPPFFTIAATNIHGVSGIYGMTALACWRDRLILWSSDVNANLLYQLVYTPERDEWTAWTLPGGSFTAALMHDGSNGMETLAFGDSTNNVCVLSDTATDDTGTAIRSYYRSSFYSPIGSPSQECKILESVLEGQGAPSFSVSHDYGAVPTTGGGAKTSVTLGTAPAYARAKHRKSQKGRRFSYQIEATSGAWRVNSIVQHVRSIRPPGVKSS